MSKLWNKNKKIINRSISQIAFQRIIFSLFDFQSIEIEWMFKS